MTEDNNTDAKEIEEAPKQLTPAAQRALQEAQERRKAQEASASVQQKEIGGRDGPEPARYGDWESNGTICDF